VRRAAALALVAATLGCEAASSDAVTVADSAGVHITLSADGDRTFAEVSGEPLLDLGGAGVWARIYTVDPFAQGTWDVYAPDRVWQGQVRTPARFFVHAVEADRLIGVWYDELDVEHVRAYELSLDSNPRGPSP
jgi:hypothetical protein